MHGDHPAATTKNTILSFSSAAVTTATATTPAACMAASSNSSHDDGYGGDADGLRAAAVRQRPDLFTEVTIQRPQQASSIGKPGSPTTAPQRPSLLQ
ncbi:hypothetical protein C2845_PMPSC055579 [Panicum miliaceum]|uniref:Uncharacterized protein n=1 Tax=Panicum miliaceum TaxID=4540 RepID=A0A3L6PB05_PANMI|nr:hypothetical protein C2845_PMPSC055579 [Panicum miliaceum]